MSEPKIRWIGTDAMRPTQGAVGYLEVRLKVQELRERAATQGTLDKYLKIHPIPAVLGPDGRMYLTDHHHMGLALTILAQEWDEDDRPAAKNPFRTCCFQITKDLSDRMDISMRQFFLKLEEHGWCHPYDGAGKRIEKLPKYLSELVDDPYRSLAGLARKAGAYNKVDVPYTEFKWADFFRAKVPQDLITEQDIARAIRAAMLLANDASASRLPGFRGIRPVEQLASLDEISERITKRHGADDAAPNLPPLKKRHSVESQVLPTKPVH